MSPSTSRARGEARTVQSCASAGIRKPYLPLAARNMTAYIHVLPRVDRSNTLEYILFWYILYFLLLPYFLFLVYFYFFIDSLLFFLFMFSVHLLFCFSLQSSPKKFKLAMNLFPFLLLFFVFTSFFQFNLLILT